MKNVVHYENLSSEFDALMKKYNIDVTLPPKEEGIYADAQKSRLSFKDLDPEAIALINEFAKVDFEKFGYQMVEKPSLFTLGRNSLRKITRWRPRSLRLSNFSTI